MQVFYSHEKWKLGVLRTQLDKVQGKFNVGGGEIDQDSYYSYFAYCLLAGLVFEQLGEKELKKQMLFEADSVLNMSNLTSRVTKFISAIRKMQVSSKIRLGELHRSGGL